MFFLGHWKRGLGEILDLDGVFDGLALLGLSGNGLGTHDTSAPVALALLVFFAVTFLDGGDELGELSLVLRPDLGQSKNGSGLF